MINKAITLVEMIIGLAITAVLVATALVSLNFVDGRKLDTQARSMLSDLFWVRESAASLHNNYIISFDTTNETYSIYNGSVSPANLTRKQRLTVNLVNVTDWSNNPMSQISFSFPLGKPSDKVWINLSQSKRSRRLNISDETGFIKME